MEQATLSTARLQLVPLADEHLEHLVELDSDPEVMRYLAHGPSSRETTEQAHRACLEQARTMPRMGFWAGSTGGQFVGWWLLRTRSRTPEDGEIELGYRLLRRFWRQGLASEGSRELIRHAFEDLAATQVYAETMAVNQASRATMTAVGLRYARAFHHDRDPSRIGAAAGDVEYAITRAQWLAAHP